MKISELTSEERAKYRRYINKQLEKEMALAAIRHLLEKQGVDPELARELVKTEGYKHASAAMQKAYMSIGGGGILAIYFLYQGMTETEVLGMHPFIYGLATFTGGIIGFSVFYKRYKYLKNLD